MNNKQKELCSKINEAFYRVDALCNSVGSAASDLRRSVIEASRQEREHRAGGRRLVGGIGRRAPVEVVARYFALRGFFRPARERSFGDRSDFVAAYAAAQGVERVRRDEYKALRKELAEVLAIDYSQDLVW